MRLMKMYLVLFTFPAKYRKQKSYRFLLYINKGRKNLINRLSFQEPVKVLDPCCGTGNFLLQLPDVLPFDSIYGNDIDAASVKITRLNMALKYNVPVAAIYEHITGQDYLTDYAEKDFQYIIGNPPWGYDFSEEEKSHLRTIYKSATGKT